jgi:hypothetical protein
VQKQNFMEKGGLIMKLICAGLMLMVASVGLMANESEASAKPESQMTVQELDGHIRFLKENIEKYNGMARLFDQKAGSLQSHDFTGSRDAALIRDECRGIAQDLESHLAKLEEQRAKMVEQQQVKK